MSKRKPPSRHKKSGPNKSLKGRAGRKQFDGRDPQEVVDKLSEIWQIGGNDYEAAMWARIDPATLTRYLAKNPKIVQIKDYLTAKPIIKARKTVYDNLDQPNMARWFLKKKRPEEFADKLALTGDNGAPLFKPVEIVIATALKKENGKRKSIKDKAGTVGEATGGVESPE